MHLVFLCLIIRKSLKESSAIVGDSFCFDIHICFEALILGGMRTIERLLVIWLMAGQVPSLSFSLVCHED